MVRFNKLNLALWVFAFPAAYIWSLFLLQYYVAGDQVHYRAFYEIINSASLKEAFLLARAYIDAGEPVTIFILWLGSSFSFPKDQYISFFNAILVMQVILLLRKYKAGFVVILLFLSNYYLIVLMTGAERLKFAYIFLLMSVLLNSNMSRLFFFAAPLAHFQSLVFAPSLLLSKFYEEVRSFLKKGFFSGRFLFFLFSVTVIFVFFLAIFFPSLASKALAYASADRSPLVILNLLVLTVVALLASRNWKRMLVVLLPFYPLVLILGGERVNMVAITLSLWVLMTENRLRHPLVLLMLLYFSFKSFSFVRNILLFGHGFA